MSTFKQKIDNNEYLTNKKKQLNKLAANEKQFQEKSAIQKACNKNEIKKQTDYNNAYIKLENSSSENSYKLEDKYLME